MIMRFNFIYFLHIIISFFISFFFFFFNDTATTEIYTLSLHDAPPIFQARPLTVPALDSRRTQFQFAMDIDSDGGEELLVPNTRVFNSCFATTDPKTREPVNYCGVDFDTQPGLSYSSFEKSVFVWDAYKFIEASDGSYSMLKMTTNLKAPTRISVLQNDSNGVGTTNKTCYRYQDAMLNTEGRGFQGFKTIVAEEQMPPAAGEPTSSITGCGGTCSLNNRRTTSEFF